MSQFIVEFPGEWFLRVGRNPAMPVATGDRERATRFDTALEATHAVNVAKTLKRDAKRNAKIVAA